jgi:hypothetical protein
MTKVLTALVAILAVAADWLEKVTDEQYRLAERLFGCAHRQGRL